MSNVTLEVPSYLLDALHHATRSIQEGQPSRRERIATAALQGLLAGAVETDGLPAVFDLNMAAWAVKQADALIAALDKPAKAEGP